MNVAHKALLAFLEVLPMPVVIADTTNGEILWVNRPHVELSGALSPDHIVGRSLFEFLGPEQLQIALRDVEAVSQGESPDPVVYHVHGLNGTTADVSIASTPVEYDRRPAMVSVLLDVTTSERRMADVRRSEARYRAMVDESPGGILVAVGDEVVYANAAAARLLRAPDPEAIIGKLVVKHLDPETRKSLRGARDRALMTGENSVGIELTLTSPDQPPVRAVATVSPLEWDGEAAIRVGIRARRSTD